MLSKLKDGPVLAWILAAIATVGIIVLAAMRVTVPAELWALDTALIGGGLGITNPTGTVPAATSIDQAAA